MQATGPKPGVTAWTTPARRHLGLSRQLAPAVALAWILVHLPPASAAGLTVEKAFSLPPIPRQGQSRGFEATMRNGTTRVEAALGPLGRAVEVDPQLFVAQQNLGDTGDLDAQVRAAQALEKTLELRPGDLKASADLASLYARFGLDREALEVLDAAAATAPDSASLELERFRILQRLGEYRMARRAVEHAIELGAGADAHYYLGFVLKNLGEVDGAIQAFRTATDVDPGMGVAQRELGSLLIDRQLFDEARIVLEQAVATTASDPEAHYLLGLALLRRGDPAGAIPSLERAVQLAPDDSRAHYNLATALRMAGRSEESTSTMRRFQELRALAQPGVARMEQHVGRLIRQGVFLAKLGRAERAVHAFQRGLENDPDNDLILFNLGVALRDVGNREEAVSALERAIEINPNRAAAYAALANAYSALGRLEDAARMRARYEELRRRRGSE